MVRLLVLLSITTAMAAFVVATEWWPNKDLDISEVERHAADLDRASVTVRGIIVSTTGGGLLGGGVYHLRDAGLDDATLPVFTQHDLPQVGSVMRLRARVRMGLIVNGRAFGTVLLEERRLIDPQGWLRHLVPAAIARASSISTASAHVLYVEAENRHDGRCQRDTLRHVHDRRPAGMVLRFCRPPEEQEQNRQ